ncbi:MAG: peptidoglycan editing factor PgeF [Bacteroidales bacterium]|nr:peptidoglycan editing factor PgeF [Candidatus Physcousia equi]
MFKFKLPDNVLAFTTSRRCEGGTFGVDARTLGIHEDDVCIPPARLVIPRQTHSTKVSYVNASSSAGAASAARQEEGARPSSAPATEAHETLSGVDAVWTDTPELCVAVKTADCIPVLLYDQRQQRVAAIHAGWRGTVGHIVTRTIEAMQSCGADLHAIIGPGISLDAFEVGDEVYDAFSQAGFPMQRIARRYPAPTSSEPCTMSLESTKWHLDLWEANRWLLLESGIPASHIQVSGICTYSHLSQLYSARQETIHTGRNLNGIMLRPQ